MGKSIFASRFAKYLYFPLLLIAAVTFFNSGSNIELAQTQFPINVCPHTDALDLCLWQRSHHYQFVSQCHCARRHNNSTKMLPLLLSTCSDEGTFYTPGQRVISMSMHYKTADRRLQEMYKEGIAENLRNMRKFYPGSSLRIYTDVDLEGDYCNLVCNNSDLFWCDIRKTPELGDQSKLFFMMWRFLPLGDPTVDYFLSRDLDSVISEREVSVISDWLGTSKPFHLMRDKERAHNTAILGGLWGARNNLLGEDAPKLRRRIMEMDKVLKKLTSRELDQKVLKGVIFYPRHSDIVAYDSYHCKKWKDFTEVRPFPVRRKDNKKDFVGNVQLGRQEFNLSKCPVECRPKYGKDWEYC